MTSQPTPTNVPVVPVGQVAGVAWLHPSPGGAELTVIGKLVLLLGHDGTAALVPPEAPGWNLGRAAPEEIEPNADRKVAVRGPRALPGRVILRRGTTTMVEVDVQPGASVVAQHLSNTMQTTTAGRRGDEWLVLEGFEGAGSRRWCKLPKLGLIAGFAGPLPGANERVLLTSRLCIVDVSTFTIAFVMRATRKLTSARLPRELTLAIMDLEQAAAALLPPPPASPLPTTAPLRPNMSGGPLLTTMPGELRAQAPALPFAPASEAPPMPMPPPVGVAGSTGELPPLPAVGSALPFVAEDESTGGVTRVVSDVAPEATANPLPFQDPLPFDEPSAVTSVISDLPRHPTLPFAKPPADMIAVPPAIVAAPPIVEAPAPVVAAAPPVVTAPPIVETPPPVVAAPAIVETPPPEPTIAETIGMRMRDGASLADLDLKGAKLAGAVLRHAKLGGLDFTNADLSGADLGSADLTRAKLDQAKLDGATLDGATLMRTSFERASLRGASLKNVLAREVVLSGADLDGANLTGGDLRRAKLVGATITNAQAKELNAQQADFTGADLGGSHLEGAMLRGATLRRARLGGAAFHGADLRDADLREASPDDALEGAKVAGARRT